MAGADHADMGIATRAVLDPRRRTGAIPASAKSPAPAARIPRSAQRRAGGQGGSCSSTTISSACSTVDSGPGRSPRPAPCRVPDGAGEDDLRRRRSPRCRAARRPGRRARGCRRPCRGCGSGSARRARWPAASSGCAACSRASRSMSRQRTLRAEAHAVVADLDVAEPGHIPQVDQQRGRREAERHHRHEALAARERLRRACTSTRAARSLRRAWRATHIQREAVSLFGAVRSRGVESGCL